MGGRHLHQASGLHHGHPVGHGKRLLLVVSDMQGGDAVLALHALGHQPLEGLQPGAQGQPSTAQRLHDGADLRFGDVRLAEGDGVAHGVLE